MDTKEIRMETEGGTLVVYTNPQEQDVGIMFIPKNTDEEIDVAYVKCVDNANHDINCRNHGPLKNLHVFGYGDVYDESYTHDFTIDADEAYQAVTESYQPDSAKL